MEEFKPNTTILPRLMIPFVMLLLIALVYFNWRWVLDHAEFNILHKSKFIFGYTVEILLWLFTAWMIVRLIDVFFWSLLIERKTNHKTPRLLKDILASLIFFSAFLGIIGVVFSHSVTGLLAASGAVGLVIGLAIRNIISDVFDGVSINFDKPFTIGDYVYLHDRSLNTTGRVMETSWRTTRLETDSNSILVVPNSKICSIPITNLSINKKSNFSLTFYFSIAIPTDRVMLMLICAAKSSNGILDTPEPSARVDNITNGGVEYKLSYWIETVKHEPLSVKNDIIAQVIYLSRLANMPFAMSKQTIYFARHEGNSFGTTIHKKEFINKVTLFADLNESELQILVDDLIEIEVKAGAVVTSIGERDDSMFIVTSGLLSASIKIENRDELSKVSYLASGDCFGEMSLLTGEARSATITSETEATLFKVDKVTISKILEGRPSLAENMSLIVAKRRTQNDNLQEEILNSDRIKSEAHTLSAIILEKMKKLFQL